MAQVLQRVDLMLNYLHQRLPGKRVLLVCHGELMWAFRIRFERLNQVAYMDMAREARRDERIENGSVLRYTRQNPESGEIEPQFGWRQLATPWLPEMADPGWSPLVDRPVMDSAALMELVNRFPRMYKHSMVAAEHMYKHSMIVAEDMYEYDEPNEPEVPEPDGLRDKIPDITSIGKNRFTNAKSDH